MCPHQNPQLASHLHPGGPIPQNMAKGFDAPPTLERSGSEHRRAVTSPPSEEEGLGVEVEPSLEGGTGWFEKMKFKRNLFKVSFI